MTHLPLLSAIAWQIYSQWGRHALPVYMMGQLKNLAKQLLTSDAAALGKRQNSPLHHNCISSWAATPPAY
jgi:hypothetical protein